MNIYLGGSPVSQVESVTMEVLKRIVQMTKQAKQASLFKMVKNIPEGCFYIVHRTIITVRVYEK
jgi:hypothetical protein